PCVATTSPPSSSPWWTTTSSGATQCSRAAESLLRQVLRRQLQRFVLRLPHQRHDPPALAVVHELDGVDAAHRVVVAGDGALVGTEHVGDVAELFGTSRQLLLGETTFDQERPGSGDVVVGLQEAHAGAAVGAPAH